MEKPASLEDLQALRGGALSMPFFTVAVAVVTLLAIWLMTRSSIGEYISSASDLSGRVQKADAKRTTRSWSFDSPQGHIEVVDIRDGTEFTRLITMPKEATIAASGYINSWNEEQVRQLAVSNQCKQ